MSTQEWSKIWHNTQLDVSLLQASSIQHAYPRRSHAQQLIWAGWPLAEVAVEVGFSSQSHLTQCFKRIIGVIPGQYAALRR